MLTLCRVDSRWQSQQWCELRPVLLECQQYGGQLEQQHCRPPTGKCNSILRASLSPCWNIPSTIGLVVRRSKRKNNVHESPSIPADMKRDKQLTLADVANPKHIEKSILLACKGKNKRPNTQKLKDTAKERAAHLSESLLNQTYQIGRYNEFDICERGKQRHIQHVYLIDPQNPDTPTSDGGVIRALVEAIEPSVLNKLTDNTHAAIKGHGIHLALSQLRKYLKDDPEGTRYCYKIDIRKYFPNIDRQVLKEKMRRIWTDPKLLWLIDYTIDSAPGDIGLPIGNHSSQLYANLYLSDFDHWVQNTLRARYFIRYMDDVVILAGTKDELRAIHREIEWYLRRNLNLEIKSNWQIFPISARGIDFVGYRTWHNRVLLRKSTYKRMIIACRKIRMNILTTATFSDTDRSILASYTGIILHCTPKVRQGLYARHIRPILNLLPHSAKPQVPEGLESCNEHMHKYPSTSNSRPQSAVERT